MNNNINIEKVDLHKINLSDTFFDSLRNDYKDFDNWFKRKQKENTYAYVTFNKNKISSFLMLKSENEKEIYDFSKNMLPKKRLKISTLKVIERGNNIGEKFLEIAVKEAKKMNAEEIYTTLYEKHTQLINVLMSYGFEYYCIKNTTNEQVYIKKLGD